MDKMYSGKKVIKAGDFFLKPTEESEAYEREKELAMNVMSYWRLSHEEPLNEAEKLLSDITNKHDRRAAIAKRLKRHPSIVSKLKRIDKDRMKLKTMQDIGGCRAIVSSEKKLRLILKDLCVFDGFIYETGQKLEDYISTPKPDGYRGVHIIGKFGSGDGERKIEVQLRTKIQHYWATSLEIVDLFNGQKLKQNKGDARWASFFTCISEQFAIMESIHLFENLDFHQQQLKYKAKVVKNKENIQSFHNAKYFIKDLKVIKIFEAYFESVKIISKNISDLKVDGYVLININLHTIELTASVFKASELKAAEAEYLRLEKKFAKDDMLVAALVATTALGGIKEAYPNYFADSTKFMDLIRVIEYDEKSRPSAGLLKSLKKTIFG